MAVSVTLLGLLAVVCLLIYQYILRPTILSPLRRIPNVHWTSPFTTLYVDKKYINTGNDRHFHRVYAAHACHGPLVRLGPSEVGVNSLEGLKKVYVSGQLEKDPWYQVEFAIQFGHPPMVAMPKRESHTARKRLVAGVYARSAVLKSVELHRIAGKVVGGRLVPILRNAAGEGKALNVLSLFHWAGADLLSAFQLGTAHGTTFLTDEETRTRYFGPEITGSWWDCRPYGAELFLGKTRAAIAELGSESEDETQPVVLSKLYHGLKDSKSPLSSDELSKACASELLDNLVASHEGVGITLTYALWELSRQPALQTKLRAEISTLSPHVPTFVSEKEADAASLPSLTSIDSLPLLHAIIQETLRRHAAAPGMQLRIVGPNGLELHGIFLPPGTRVSSNAYSLHRYEDAYPDAEQWRPERWMSGESGLKGGTEAERWFWPFSSGGRMCIGSHFAVAMLKVVLAIVYANFTTEIVDDEGIEQVEDFIAGPKSNKLFLRFRAAQ